MKCTAVEKERALERWRDLAFRVSASALDNYPLRDAEREAYLYWASLVAQAEARS